MNDNYMDVRVFWPEDLGPCWMNLDNLKRLLFSTDCVATCNLAAAQLDHSEDHRAEVETRPVLFDPKQDGFLGARCPDPSPEESLQILKDIGVAPEYLELADLTSQRFLGAQDVPAILEALAEEEVLQPSFEIGECAVHKLTGTCVMVLDTITYSLEDNACGFRDGYWVRFQDDKEPRKVFDFELMKREE